MSQSTPVLDKTLLAAGDLSTKQFYGVKMSSDYTVTTSTANPTSNVGVQQDVPGAAGRGCRVRMLGTSKVVAGAAFAAGASLTTNAAGQFVTATAGQNRDAKALQAAAALGDIVEVLLTPGGAVPV